MTSATFDDFVDEILRLVTLIGVDHVAIGTDLDANYRPVITAHRQFATLAEHLADRGLTAAEVDQILGANVVELLPSGGRLSEGGSSAKVAAAIDARAATTDARRLLIPTRASRIRSR